MGLPHSPQSLNGQMTTVSETKSLKSLTNPDDPKLHPKFPGYKRELKVVEFVVFSASTELEVQPPSGPRQTIHEIHPNADFNPENPVNHNDDWAQTQKSHLSNLLGTSNFRIVLDPSQNRAPLLVEKNTGEVLAGPGYSQHQIDWEKDTVLLQFLHVHVRTAESAEICALMNSEKKGGVMGSLGISNAGYVENAPVQRKYVLLILLLLLLIPV